jgi:hypothetical protein
MAKKLSMLLVFLLLASSVWAKDRCVVKANAPAYIYAADCVKAYEVFEFSLERGMDLASRDLAEGKAILVKKGTIVDIVFAYKDGVQVKVPGETIYKYMVPVFLSCWREKD